MYLMTLLSWRSKDASEDCCSAVSWKTGYKLRESLCGPWCFDPHILRLHQWSHCYSSGLEKMPVQGPENHSTLDEAFHLPSSLSSLSSKICKKLWPTFHKPIQPWVKTRHMTPLYILSSIVFPGKCFILFVTRAQYSNKLLKLTPQRVLGISR